LSIRFNASILLLLAVVFLLVSSVSLGIASDLKIYPYKTAWSDETLLHFIVAPGDISVGSLRFSEMDPVKSSILPVISNNKKPELFRLGQFLSRHKRRQYTNPLNIVFALAGDYSAKEDNDILKAFAKSAHVRELIRAQLLKGTNVHVYLPGKKVLHEIRKSANFGKVLLSVKNYPEDAAIAASEVIDVLKLETFKSGRVDQIPILIIVWPQTDFKYEPEKAQKINKQLVQGAVINISNVETLGNLLWGSKRKMKTYCASNSIGYAEVDLKVRNVSERMGGVLRKVIRGQLVNQVNQYYYLTLFPKYLGASMRRLYRVTHPNGSKDIFIDINNSVAQSIANEFALKTITEIQDRLKFGEMDQVRSQLSRLVKIKAARSSKLFNSVEKLIKDNLTPDNYPQGIALYHRLPEMGFLNKSDIEKLRNYVLGRLAGNLGAFIKKGDMQHASAMITGYEKLLKNEKDWLIKIRKNINRGVSKLDSDVLESLLNKRDFKNAAILLRKLEKNKTLKGAGLQEARARLNIEHGTYELEQGNADKGIALISKGQQLLGGACVDGALGAAVVEALVKTTGSSKGSDPLISKQVRQLQKCHPGVLAKVKPIIGKWLASQGSFKQLTTKVGILPSIEFSRQCLKMAADDGISNAKEAIQRISLSVAKLDHSLTLVEKQYVKSLGPKSATAFSSYAVLSRVKSSLPLALTVEHLHREAGLNPEMCVKLLNRMASKPVNASLKEQVTWKLAEEGPNELAPGFVAHAVNEGHKLLLVSQIHETQIVKRVKYTFYIPLSGSFIQMEIADGPSSEQSRVFQKLAGLKNGRDKHLHHFAFPEYRSSISGLASLLSLILASHPQVLDLSFINELLGKLPHGMVEYLLVLKFKKGKFQKFICVPADLDDQIVFNQQLNGARLDYLLTVEAKGQNVIELGSPSIVYKETNDPKLRKKRLGIVRASMVAP
jgi:hypothetical protein